MVAMTGAALVLGALAGVQVHSQQVRGATEGGRRTRALISMLTAGQAQLDEQRQEIERLRARAATYEKEAASDKGLTRLMNEELDSSRIAMGLLPAKGPGISLELGDSTIPAGEDAAGQDLFVVHDYDLLHLANELWAAGAEAVSLNGQRLVAASSIICSGRLIQVNKVTVSGPFTFVAIGNKENLISALNIRDGYLDRLRTLKFQVKLTALDEAVVPPVAVTPKYEYAQPVVEEESG
jgi:uncharacterized protein YlxW (UPF0749 family)